jgi:uncharacterized protein (UPF0333 family)
MFKRGIDSRGQLSVEYLLLLVVIFVVFGAMITYLIGPSIDAANDISDVSAASNAINTIANAVNVVYANGPGSKRTFKVYIPQDNFVLNRSGTNINGTVNLANGSQKIVAAKMDYSVNYYSWTFTKGWYNFVVQWKPNTNNISVGLY